MMLGTNVEKMFQTPIPKLYADDIEVKVKQVTEKGAVALLYKTARTDMRILDMCVGPENWQDVYQEIKGNLYCTIKIRNPVTGEWVGKTDCGTESREDGEGNQKKGEASDAFKRAGFKWGIGRELYTAPFIFLKVPTVRNGNRFELRDRFDRFSVKNITYRDNRSIKDLVIVNQRGAVVYSSKGKSDPAPDAAPTSAAQQPAPQQQHHSLTCDLCGQPISAIMYQGQTLTAQQTADRFGKCLVCLQVEAAQRQAG